MSHGKRGIGAKGATVKRAGMEGGAGSLRGTSSTTTAPEDVAMCFADDVVIYTHTSAAETDDGSSHL